MNAILAKDETEKVLHVDADPQASSATYHHRAITRYPDLEHRFICRPYANEEQLAERLQQADEEGFAYVIIDTAGSHKDPTKYLFAEADRAIVPFRPSLKEYESQLATIELYHQVRMVMEEHGLTAPVVKLVLNDWSENQRMTADQRTILATIHEEPLLASFYVPSRNGFDTLDQGFVIYKEMQNPEVATNFFINKSRKEELEIALDTLRNIEVMQ